MNSLNTSLLTGMLLLTLLNCAPVNIEYLKPIGEGELSASSTCGGPKDRITVSLVNEVDLSLRALPHEKLDYFTIYIGVRLKKDTSFQFLSSQVTINSAEYSKVEKVDMGYLVAQVTGKAYGTKNYSEYFRATIEISKKAPKQFQLKLPGAKINGSDIMIEPITFELKKGVFIFPFLCP